MKRVPLFAGFALALAPLGALITGCGGGSGGNATPTAAPTFTPAPPGAVSSNLLLENGQPATFTFVPYQGTLSGTFRIFPAPTPVPTATATTAPAALRGLSRTNKKILSRDLPAETYTIIGTVEGTSPMNFSFGGFRGTSTTGQPYFTVSGRLPTATTEGFYRFNFLGELSEGPLPVTGLSTFPTPTVTPNVTATPRASATPTGAFQSTLVFTHTGSGTFFNRPLRYASLQRIGGTIVGQVSSHGGSVPLTYPTLSVLLPPLDDFVGGSVNLALLQRGLSLNSTTFVYNGYDNNFDTFNDTDYAVWEPDSGVIRISQIQGNTYTISFFNCVYSPDPVSNSFGQVTVTGSFTATLGNSNGVRVPIHTGPTPGPNARRK